jgi:hypothetical protein
VGESVGEQQLHEGVEQLLPADGSAPDRGSHVGYSIRYWSFHLSTARSA